MLHICQEVADDQSSHIQAIESARNKKIYDKLNEYQTFVVESQGKEEYDTFLHNTKQQILQTFNGQLILLKWI
jgi:hypothetical protein